MTLIKVKMDSWRENYIVKTADENNEKTVLLRKKNEQLYFSALHDLVVQKQTAYD